MEIQSLDETVEGVRSSPRLGTQLYSGGGDPFPPLPEIGKEAFHGSRAEGHLHIRALTEKGIGLSRDVTNAGRTSAQLLPTLSSLMKKAVARADKKFPGPDKIPARKQPPQSPCRVATADEIERSLGTPIDETSRMIILRDDRWYAWFEGSVITGWSCHVWGDDPPGGGYRDFTITLFSEPRSIDEMKRWGEPVPRVGTHAFWVAPTPLWPQGTLSVLSSKGKVFEIETAFQGPDSLNLDGPSQREAAVSLARSILARV